MFSFCLSICLPVLVYVYRLSVVCPSASPPAGRSVCLYTLVSVYLSARVYICRLSICLPGYVSVCLSLYDMLPSASSVQ